MGKSLLGDTSKPDRYVYAHALYDSFYVQIGNQHTRYFSYENYDGSKDKARSAARAYRDELENKIVNSRKSGQLILSTPELTTPLADGLKRVEGSLASAPSPSAPVSHVFWTLEEMQTLASDAASMSVRNPMTMLSAIRTAQIKFPKHRQRDFQSTTAIPPALVELFNKTRESIIRGYEDAVESSLSKEEPPPAKQVSLGDFSEDEIYAELRRKSEERYSARFLELEKKLAEKDEKISAMVTQFANFSQKMADQDALMEMLMEDVNKAASNLVYKTHQIHDPSKKKINIAVAGLLNSQFNTVVQIVANSEIELIHYPTDKSPSFSQNHDYIVLSKFISHAWQDTAHKAVGRERTYFVSGGLRSIVDTINQLASKYQENK